MAPPDPSCNARAGQALAEMPRPGLHGDRPVRRVSPPGKGRLSGEPVARTQRLTGALGKTLGLLMDSETETRGRPYLPGR